MACNSDETSVHSVPREVRLSDSIQMESKAEAVSLNTQRNISQSDVNTIQNGASSIDSLARMDKRSEAWKTLVDIQSIDPSIRIDLKYATRDNFMKMKLYDTLTKVYLQKEVALRLSACQKYLKSINKNLSLLVYDGVRPLSVQQKMWKALDSIPVKERGKFVSNPANGSIHNYGAAVDLTLCDEHGRALDMGAGYDDIRTIAYPKLEAHFLSTGELTKEQVDNRKMLRKIMTSQDFRNIPTEWWHFNACSRQTAKAKYILLR